jgi:hypothetical protein
MKWRPCWIQTISNLGKSNLTLLEDDESKFTAAATLES